MKKVLRITAAVILMAACIVGYYGYLSNRNASVKAEDNVTLSEIDAIVTKDFSTDYPSTPRSVIKWYNRMITALYAEDYDEDQFQIVADQLREVLDDELLQYNPRDQYVSALRSDVTYYKNRNRVIVNSDVSDTNEVRYDTVKGDSVAFVSAYYFIREGSSYDRTYQDYCLRQDSHGRWKILTFKLSDKDDTNDF
ncbi:MAG: hypothetical protein HUJ71_01180 [Pseudobutyrivibrio sp.]|nr:hypothetical protein [Pseudobutyrivibrio sp.]